jgi:flagellar biosynthesis chaperone FliJ
VNRRFRLGAVERLRSGKLAEAARTLGLARRDVVQAQDEQTRISRELVKDELTGPDAAFMLRMAASRRERMRADLVQAGERVSVARSREVSALAGWNSAKADLRAVELLHARHKQAVADADARAEQRLIDELAARPRRADLRDDLLDDLRDGLVDEVAGEPT